MKRLISLLLCGAVVLSLAACGAKELPQPQLVPEAPAWDGAYDYAIELADRNIKITSPDGKNIHSAVWASNDIVYYEEGHDFTYGEGEPGDAHSAEEAAKHTVVTIREPGTYVLSGKLSAGQIAVDLGEEAEEDPNAVVTLVLDGVDITCTVAPAIIFYNVYECGDEDNPTKDVDTSAAGANVYINDGTENFVNGSYVARIYKPDSVVLNEDGTEVEDAKKLHKYDAAFYSKMSMNVDGGKAGVLRIKAENEGLDSEMHLTINGGSTFIESGNDGINTNEDGVSVTTINGGELYITVTGETGEGDGIDSNGWLVLNGGTVVARACNNSADSGIDSDMGIYIGSGAYVMATGHMLDDIADSGQNYAVFRFDGVQSGKEAVTLKNADGEVIVSDTPVNDYSVLIVSSPILTEGDYTLWSGDTRLGHSGAQNGRGFGPGGKNPPEGFAPEDMPERPEGMMPPAWNGGERPERPERKEPPEGFDPQNMPFLPSGPGGMGGGQKVTQPVFSITTEKGNYFSGVGELQLEK